MPRLKPQTSGIGSNRSTIWATRLPPSLSVPSLFSSLNNGCLVVILSLSMCLPSLTFYGQSLLTKELILIIRWAAPKLTPKTLKKLFQGKRCGVIFVVVVCKEIICLSLSLSRLCVKTCKELLWSEMEKALTYLFHK